MNDLLQTNRMHLLKALDRYLATGFLGTQPAGGRFVACRPLCWSLWDDEHPLAPNFNSWMEDICGHEYTTWRRLGGTWSAAARAAAYFIDNAVIGERGRPIRPQGLWVSHALGRARPSAQWALNSEALLRGNAIDAE